MSADLHQLFAVILLLFSRLTHNARRSGVRLSLYDDGRSNGGGCEKNVIWVQIWCMLFHCPFVRPRKVKAFETLHTVVLAAGSWLGLVVRMGTGCC